MYAQVALNRHLELNAIANKVCLWQGKAFYMIDKPSEGGLNEN